VDRVGKGIVSSGGPEVTWFWGGKPRTGGEKGSRAQGTGSHVVFGGKPLAWSENGMGNEGGVRRGHGVPREG